MRDALNSYLETTGSEWYKTRISGTIFCVLGAFVILFVRIFYLQVIEGKEFRRLSESNCIRLQSIDAPRGLIFDRKGKLLVDNRPSFDLGIILKDAKPIERTIEKLARYLDIPVQELESKIKSSKRISAYAPILLKQDVGRNALATVEVHKFDLPGVVVHVKPRRNYINKETASHLIGYLGEISSEELNSGKYPESRGGDFIGKFGVEKAYENDLSGKPGGRQVEVNAKGQVVRILRTLDAEPGDNIFLTVDREVQSKAEALLKGTAGAVVAMEPASGQILALASSPSFDQNVFVSGMTHEQWDSLIANPFRPMENKVIQGEYPPASTYKIVTAMAGLEEGIIDENTEIHCPGHYNFGDRVFRCWKRGGHGAVSVVKALAESCDVFFYQVGQKVGIDRLAWYARACGFGSPTGIRLDHESPGLVPTAAWKKRRTGVAWQRGETLSIAIGQGYNLATPLQMLGLTSAVAIDGARRRPIILAKIETAEGQVAYRDKSQIVGRLPASRGTLEIVRKGLREVVNTRRGTAWIAHVDGLDISGKTGTAQVFSRKKTSLVRGDDRPAHLKSHAWFVAYAPSDDPQIAIAVIVEHGEHGSSTAAPIARELIKTYFME